MFKILSLSNSMKYLNSVDKYRSSQWLFEQLNVWNYFTTINYWKGIPFSVLVLKIKL